MRRSGRARNTPVLFVTWSFNQGRSKEIAAALDGDVCAVYPRRLDGARLSPLRYAVSSVLTLVALVRRRPGAVIVTNPPIFPSMIVWAYGAIRRIPVLLDSHPGAFGRKDNRVAQFFMPAHRWLARRSAAVLVTTDDWVDVVNEWGGTGVVVHEAPPTWEVARPVAPTGRPQVLFVGIFANDEPVHEVVEAARRLPDVDVGITGHLERAPADVVAGAPSNVSFLGYLDTPEYRDAVERCDVLLALTTEPTSVMRAAYEGVYARRPIIISDWPALRKLFPAAVFTTNDAAGIEDSIRSSLDRLEVLDAAADDARAAQQARWDDQLATIVRLAAGRTDPTREHENKVSR